MPLEVKSFYCSAGEHQWYSISYEDNFLKSVFNPPEIKKEPASDLTVERKSEKEFTIRVNNIELRFIKENCNKLEADTPQEYTCYVKSKSQNYDGCGSIEI